MDNHHVMDGGKTSHQSIPLLNLVADPMNPIDPTGPTATNEISSVLPMEMLVLALAPSRPTGRGTTINALVAMIGLEVQADFRKEAIKGVDIKVTDMKVRMVKTILMAKRVISNAMSAHHAVSSASLGTSSAIIARHAILIDQLVLTRTMVTH